MFLRLVKGRRPICPRSPPVMSGSCPGRNSTASVPSGLRTGNARSRIPIDALVNQFRFRFPGDGAVPPSRCKISFSTSSLAAIGMKEIVAPAIKL